MIAIASSRDVTIKEAPCRTWRMKPEKFPRNSRTPIRCAGRSGDFSCSAITQAPYVDTVCVHLKRSPVNESAGCNTPPALPVVTRSGIETRKQFFFEKKNQKTFVRCGLPSDHREAHVLPVTSKSFLFLFFKKEILPFLLPTQLLPPPIEFLRIPPQRVLFRQQPNHMPVPVQHRQCVGLRAFE